MQPAQQSRRIMMSLNQVLEATRQFSFKQIGSITDRLISHLYDSLASEAAKAVHGADSSEYEMTGGTRASERKRPTRKPKQAELADIFCIENSRQPD